MIVPRPTDEQIRSAQVITLFDPQRPGFFQVVVDNLDRTKSPPKDALVVDIPVDSINFEMMEHWLDWITRARSESSL
jgi:hypothetical protein